MPRRYRDESWLRDRYWDDGLTQAEIADDCGVSPRCIRKWMRKHRIETRDPVEENHGLHGEQRADETKAKISNALDGRDVSDETRQRMSDAHEGNELDESTRKKLSQAIQGITRSKETRRKMSESTAGEANPNWRGGYSNRYGARWPAARAAVRDRDGVCQNCGHDGSEHRLEVHHVVPVRLFRDADHVSVKEAHALDNLVLLCKPCHGKAEQDVIEFPVPYHAIPEAIGEIYK